MATTAQTITQIIKTSFSDLEISNKIIYLSTDLEPDDMMAIKLLAPKLQKCKQLYVVVGEHTLGNIKNKCYLFYYLAKLYGFDHTICTSTTTGNPIIYTGHPTHEHKLFPQTIFNQTITLEGTIAKPLTEHFADSIDIVDITTTMTRDCLHKMLSNSNTIFLLMKPPKEFFFPEKTIGLTFNTNVALMYGSFNVTELNSFMESKKMDNIKLTDIAVIFPEIVYIERKPEVAMYPIEVKGNKLDPIDPNPFFGTFNPNDNFNILDDPELLSKMKNSYNAVVGTDPFLKFCTKEWQVTTLTKLAKLLDIQLNSDEMTSIDTLINIFKSKYFNDTIPPTANFKEESAGYYPEILDMKKLYDSSSDKKVAFDTFSLEQQLEQAKNIAQQLKLKGGNKWGMMIGIVLTNGEQTHLADQIIAALILDPMKFTIKKILRDNASIHTILCTSEQINTIDELKKEHLNSNKLILYKMILDIITNLGSVEQKATISMIPREDRLSILQRYNLRQSQSKPTEKFGGKKRTKKRNNKRTTNEEPTQKQKQRTRKQKRHSMTSER